MMASSTRAMISSTMSPSTARTAPAQSRKVKAAKDNFFSLVEASYKSMNVRELSLMRSILAALV
jgi:hypothetical protein